MLFAVRGRGSSVRRGLSWQSGAGLSVMIGLATIPGWAAPPDSQPATPPQAAPTPQTPAVSYTRPAQSMQTAIWRFDPISGKGPTVYLVAAVHIGEKSYYQQLQAFLDKQDIVLFERVKRSRKSKTASLAPAVKTGKPTPPANLYKQFSAFLNVQSQYDGINYNRPNFRNSDLGWDDLEALAAKSGTGTQKELAEQNNLLNGESRARAMLDSLKQEAADDPEVANQVLRAFVELLANPEKLAALSLPQTADKANLDTIIIAERNKVVLADLKALTTQPRPPRSIAIFYGAEHMRDIAQHLTDDLHYRPSTTQWLTALTAP